MAVRGGRDFVLRTGRVVVRQMTWTSPSSSLDGEGGLGDRDGQGAAGVSASEADPLAADADHAGVSASRCTRIGSDAGRVAARPGGVRAAAASARG